MAWALLPGLPLFETQLDFQRRRGLKKVGGQKVPTDSWKFPTDEIMIAQNFNFASTFFRNGDFYPKFGVCRQKFSDKKKIFNFPLTKSLGRGGGQF